MHQGSKLSRMCRIASQSTSE
ncbi:hypothetical protein Patl1_36867 [Pistacia atlantica]|nr:hypothetical protein Patl1_36867 [Pistacia atlantica]